MAEVFKTIERQVDFCVVGGGLAGLCAAVAAARHGAKVALVQERPMLGGNCSSEIRMWVCGALGPDKLETGIIEEILLENHYRNPDKNYSIWDGILYEIARNEENIELIMNCSINECEMDGDRIASVRGWQMTTQTYQKITAKLFADCSGDSVLAPLSGAEFRIGRENSAEFGESIGANIEQGDRKTMGMSIMLQAREEDHASDFIPPKWAYHYTAADLPHRIPFMDSPGENFWYLEIGGDADSIHDTEIRRDELLKIAYGMWDFVKNAPENKEMNKNWRLDWMGFLPGKRESRRYVGDVIMNQNDVEAQGKFTDIVAYGGWPMDDHDPRGFYSGDHPNINYPAPSPYGIPYRSLYSRNIANLFFAGRNISVTHWALSSTRVMSTCALLGQAAGTAAAIAIRDGLSPRGVYEQRICELKETLMEDDSYLPFNVRTVPELTRKAAIVCDAADAENLRNGLDRPIDGADNGCVLKLGQSVEYRFEAPSEVSMARIVWDSDLNRTTMPKLAGRPWGKNMLHNRPANCPEFPTPKTVTKGYRIEGIGEDGSVRVLYETEQNHQRLNHVPLEGTFAAIRLIPLSTWGAEGAHLFSFDVRKKDSTAGSI